MLFDYLPMHQCDDKAYSAARRSQHSEEQFCIGCCNAIVALIRVEIRATSSLTRSFSSTVEFTRLRIVLHFLRRDDMGNGDKMQCYFNESEHSSTASITFKWKGLEEILVHVMFHCCRNIG